MSDTHGIAKVIMVKPSIVQVVCYHCEGVHTHQRSSLGSREVVAPCSRPGGLRTYAIPHRKTGHDKRR